MMDEETKKMIKLLAVFALFAVIIVVVQLSTAGCTPGLADPNSTFNRIGDAVAPIAQTVGEGAGAIGGPWGSIVFLGTTVLSGIWGAWQRNRKRFAEDDANHAKDKYARIKDVAATVVNAVEEVSSVAITTSNGETTIGDQVKAKVKEKLTQSKSYESSKKVIDALKSGAEEGKV